MSSQNDLIPADVIAPLIRSVRDQRVILDNDLAGIYGVPTKRLNEQYRRNTSRFPKDFAFRLSQSEWAALRSQIATLKAGLDLRSQNATSSLHGGRRYLPLAFTEHGALMAANILNSPRAVAMSVYVIRALRLAEIDKHLLLHDGALRDIYHKLRPLLEPPPAPPKPEIGFHVKEDAIPYRIQRRVSQR
ncbi:MAG: ORF6N domain-containing protein [Verrucomicrobia bacterium]|nr:ORF6N domain-containing protein [Verrucomicrobiota bacterium]